MEGDFISTNPWLMPLAWLYGCGVNLRNWMFDRGLLKSEQFDVPVINVGNLTVGGTGKTPHVEYLIRLLQHDFKVAVLSRGYRRRSHGYVLARQDTPMQMIGDEPWQMKQKFPNVHVAVDADRRDGIRHLMNDHETRDVQVILLDDAFQHRYVKAGINILLVDYHRMVTDDALLPAGRLREPCSGLRRADMVIVTKCPTVMNPIDYRVIREKLKLQPFQHLYFSSIRYGELKEFRGQEVEDRRHEAAPVLLVSGIGSPRQFEMDMKQHFKQTDSIAFPDHHQYTAADIQFISEKLKSMGNDALVITTEKDAARLAVAPGMTDELEDRIQVLPIEVAILQGKENKFKTNITGYVQKSLRNGKVAQRADADKA